MDSKTWITRQPLDEIVTSFYIARKKKLTQFFRLQCQTPCLHANLSSFSFKIQANTLSLRTSRPHTTLIGDSILKLRARQTIIRRLAHRDLPRRKDRDELDFFLLHWHINRDLYLNLSPKQLIKVIL